MVLLDRQDEWEWLYGHFQHEKYLGLSKFPEIDMLKEVYIRPGDELMDQLHSTMMDKGQTVMEDVASQLPLKTPIEEVFPPEDAGFQIMTDRLDHTLGRWHGNVHQGLGKARLRDPSASFSRQRIEQVDTLTSEVVGLNEQIAAQNNFMNQIRRALLISNIQFPNVELAPEMTSQPPATTAISSQPYDTTTPPTGDCDVDFFF